MDDRAVKRAGLDYWPEVVLERHVTLEALYSSLPDARFVYFTKKADISYTNCSFGSDDCRCLVVKLAVCQMISCFKTGQTV